MEPDLKALAAQLQLVADGIAKIQAMLPAAEPEAESPEEDAAEVSEEPMAAEDEDKAAAKSRAASLIAAQMR